MITPADKGKIIVVIYNDEYSNKVHTFLSEHAIPNNRIFIDQKQIQKALHQCDLIIHKKQIKHLIQKNLSPPKLKALLKLHKPDIPIRPVIDNRNAPSYKIAKKLNDILKTLISCKPPYYLQLNKPCQ